MGLISLVLTLHCRTHFLSVYRRAKVARVIGLLASHTTELQENVPVIEVICFITEMLRMAENVLNFRTYSSRGFPLKCFSWNEVAAIK